MKTKHHHSRNSALWKSARDVLLVLETNAALTALNKTEQKRYEHLSRVGFRALAVRLRANLGLKPRKYE